MRLSSSLRHLFAVLQTSTQRQRATGQANLEHDLKAIKELQCLKLFFVPGGKHVFLFCKVRHFNTDTMGSALLLELPSCGYCICFPISLRLLTCQDESLITHIIFGKFLIKDSHQSPFDSFDRHFESHLGKCDSRDYGVAQQLLGPHPRGQSH